MHLDLLGIPQSGENVKTLLFFTFSVLIDSQPETTIILYIVASPARGLLNREKRPKILCRALHGTLFLFGTDGYGFQ